MIDQDLAKGHAAVGIVRRDLLRADAAAQPAHAMRQPRGAEPNLRILEALTCSAKHLVSRDAQVFDRHFRVTARHRIVDRIGHVIDPDSGIGQIEQEHAGAALAALVFRLGHDNAHLGPVGAGDETLLAVDHPVIAVAAAGGDHHRGIGAGPVELGRLGHEEGRP